MKHLLLATLMVLMTSCEGNATHTAKLEAVSYPKQMQQTPHDTLLAGIQSRIANAFVQSMMMKDGTPLQEISVDLARHYKKEKHNLIRYWQSYLQFYYSIFYLAYNDKENAEKEVEQAIEWMDEMKNKNSEDYALLSMLQGFSLQFKGMRAMFIGPKAKKNAQIAIALDSTNPRAYYVYASNDFYTPEQYGGGKAAEKYLKKAISLPAQKVPNNYLPSWGIEEAYELLIRLYIKKRKWDLAKKYFQEGIATFPDSYIISRWARRLVGR